jgi:hypothetical protein
MASYKLTGLGAGTALTDAANLSQVQNATASYLTSVAGTNTVTATATPTPAYTVGQRFTFVPAVTNTGATTLNISSVGAGAVQAKGAALTGGELIAGVPVTVLVTATTPVFQIVGYNRGITTIVAPTALTSGTTAEITGIPQTFTSLLLVLDSVSFDTATRALRLRISSDNGSNFNASGFYGTAVNNTTITAVANNASSIIPGTQTAAEATTLMVEITGYQAGAFTRVSAVGVSANTVDYSSSAAYLTDTLATNALRLLISDTGDFDGAGSYALYGVN